MSNITVYADALYSIDNKVLKEINQQYGKDAQKRVASLVTLLNNLKKSDTQQKLKGINDFFNAIAYKSDIKNWEKKDYWTSREEFLGVDAGDCEDYVIAKYFSLRQLGISSDKIFLSYVKAIKYRQSHMVLSYFKTKSSLPLILDNIDPLIKPANERTDLRPLFYFNGEKIYMAKQRELGRVIPQGKINLSKWSNLVLKIKRERK